MGVKTLISKRNLVFSCIPARFVFKKPGRLFLLSLLSDKPKKEGTVIESLPDTKFKVKLDDGREILAYLSGKMRMNYIKVMIGDKVTVETSPDGARGRIVYRK